MSKVKFAFESDAPQRLEINWKGGLLRVDRDINVLLDGSLVCNIPSRAELEAGKQIRLRDNSDLHVKLVDDKWQVVRDGRSLWEIAHPQRELKSAYRTFLIIAAINVIAGMLQLTGLAFKNSSPIGLAIILVCGVLFFALGLWARRKSKIAFILGVALYATETMLLMISGSHADLGAILSIIALIVVALQGIEAIQRLAV